MKVLRIPLFMLMMLALACAAPEATTNDTSGQSAGSNEVTMENSSISLASYLRKVPGVSIQNVQGGPRIVIRGQGSFGSEEQREPLIIIDGNEVGYGYQAALNQVSVNDIDRIRVLKSGSETAQYGLRGNYGVILITTKKGG